jgi:hypothetical protein
VADSARRKKLKASRRAQVTSDPPSSMGIVQGRPTARAVDPGGSGPRREEDLVEARVRARIAELVASGGLAAGTASLHALFLLPRDFVQRYEALFWRALAEESPSQTSPNLDHSGEPEGPVSRPSSQTRLSPRAKTTIGPVKKAPKRHQKHWLVRDEAALELKKQIDRKLRGLARDMKVHEQSRPATTPRCGSCKRYVEPHWNFCASCGSPKT